MEAQPVLGHIVVLALLIGQAGGAAGVGTADLQAGEGISMCSMLG